MKVEVVGSVDARFEQNCVRLCPFHVRDQHIESVDGQLGRSAT